MRVKFDIRRPIKDSIRLKKEKMNEWITVNFVYERILTFCFSCGIIGHGEKFCALLVRADGAAVPRKYGPIFVMEE